MPPKPTWHVYAYAGGLCTLTAVALDHYLDIRKWKRISYTVPVAQDTRNVSMTLSARTRPPPIGAMEWPSGRVLLQWALDEAGLGAATSGTVLEIGAGIGLTSIGLALARRDDASSSDSSSSRSTSPAAAAAAATPGTAAAAARAAAVAANPVLATDACAESLQLLRSNADGHGLVANGAVRVSEWDAAAGAAAVAALPVPLCEIDHVIAADCVYHGFGADTDERGLERTLAALLRAKPSLHVQLMIVDRFSGGAVAALSGAAGVNQTSAPTTVDPAIGRFYAECERLGLATQTRPVPEAVLARVDASLGPLSRGLWWLAGYYHGLSIVTVTLAEPGAARR